MIKRYTTPEMLQIWSEQNKFNSFLKVELAAATAFNKTGVIPKSDLQKLIKKSKFSLSRIHTLEKTLKHDVIAFTRAVSESLGPEKKWIHYGLTSTDVVDTAYALQLKEANVILKAKLMKFTNVLKMNARKYANVPTIGRTHGVHADITSFGLKWANWYDEMQRNITRFANAASQVETGKISGAVGNFANTPPRIQNLVCRELKINSAKISTQVLSRDIHAEYITAIAMVGNTIEKIATEIRHLQRTEVREVEESFGKGQKGSSAMPHKRNPITSENMTATARVLRSYVIPMMENNTLWHERDLSHSAVDRIIIPDATTLLDYMLTRYTTTLKDLVVNKKQMLKNIYLTNGVIFSQRVLTSLIDKGMAREKAYDIVQPIAMIAFDNDESFQELLLESKIIMKTLTKKEIDKLFDISFYMKNVNYILKQTGIKK